MAGFDLPVSAIRDQMASAFRVVVQLSRLSDGSRKVVSLSEVTGTEGSTVTLQDLFLFKQTGIDPDGKVLGELAPRGIRPTFADHLRAHGMDLPDSMFGVDRW